MNSIFFEKIQLALIFNPIHTLKILGEYDTHEWYFVV